MEPLDYFTFFHGGFFLFCFLSLTVWLLSGGKPPQIFNNFWDTSIGEGAGATEHPFLLAEQFKEVDELIGTDLITPSFIEKRWYEIWLVVDRIEGKLETHYRRMGDDEIIFNGASDFSKPDSDYSFDYFYWSSSVLVYFKQIPWFIDDIYIDTSGKNLTSPGGVRQPDRLWSGYVVYDGEVNTLDWLGWLSLRADLSWAWSYGLENWLYFPEPDESQSGEWAYLAKLPDKRSSWEIAEERAIAIYDELVGEGVVNEYKIERMTRAEVEEISPYAAEFADAFDNTVIMEMLLSRDEWLEELAMFALVEMKPWNRKKGMLRETIAHRSASSRESSALAMSMLPLEAFLELLDQLVNEEIPMKYGQYRTLIPLLGVKGNGETLDWIDQAMTIPNRSERFKEMLTDSRREIEKKLSLDRIEDQQEWEEQALVFFQTFLRFPNFRGFEMSYEAAAGNLMLRGIGFSAEFLRYQLEQREPLAALMVREQEVMELYPEIELYAQGDDGFADVCQNLVVSGILNKSSNQ